MVFVIAILVGMASPVQTGVNNRLRDRVGTPFGTALISFSVGLFFLIPVTAILADFNILTDATRGAPWWIWIGGFMGTIFLCGNILLMPILGSIQTAIFPVVEQLMMGLLIDHFALYNSAHTPFSALRGVGAVLVLAGVLTVTLSRQGRLGDLRSMLRGGGTTESRQVSGAFLWLCRLGGMGTGMLSATQTAINGHLGVLLGSSVKASFVSFVVGGIGLIILNLIVRDPIRIGGGPGRKDPWWIWTGGLLGVVYVLGTIYLAGILGVGMTVVAVLIGTSMGGVPIDHFGLLGAKKRPVRLMTIPGLVIMIAGAAMIKLL